MTPAAQRLAERNRLSGLFDAKRLGETETQSLPPTAEAAAAHADAAAEEKRRSRPLA